MTLPCPYPSASQSKYVRARSGPTPDTSSSVKRHDEEEKRRRKRGEEFIAYLVLHIVYSIY
jgi:hypothetical protein